MPHKRKFLFEETQTDSSPGSESGTPSKRQKTSHEKERRRSDDRTNATEGNPSGMNDGPKRLLRRLMEELIQKESTKAGTPNLVLLKNSQLTNGVSLFTLLCKSFPKLIQKFLKLGNIEDFAHLASPDNEKQFFKAITRKEKNEDEWQLFSESKTCTKGQNAFVQIKEKNSNTINLFSVKARQANGSLGQNEINANINFIPKLSIKPLMNQNVRRSSTTNLNKVIDDITINNKDNNNNVLAYSYEENNGPLQLKEMNSDEAKSNFFVHLHELIQSLKCLTVDEYERKRNSSLNKMTTKESIKTNTYFTPKQLNNTPQPPRKNQITDLSEVFTKEELSQHYLDNMRTSQQLLRRYQLMVREEIQAEMEAELVKGETLKKYIDGENETLSNDKVKQSVLKLMVMKFETEKTLLSDESDLNVTMVQALLDYYAKSAVLCNENKNNNNNNNNNKRGDIDNGEIEDSIEVDEQDFTN